MPEILRVELSERCERLIKLVKACDALMTDMLLKLPEYQYRDMVMQYMELQPDLKAVQDLDKGLEALHTF